MCEDLSSRSGALGSKEFDQRQVIYASYMDHETLNPGAPTRLRLARSRDQGRTFTAETIPVTRVVDKPELAVSPDGRRIAVVYEAATGPTIVTTADGGESWNEAREGAWHQCRGRRQWPSLCGLHRGKRTGARVCASAQIVQRCGSHVVGQPPCEYCAATAIERRSRSQRRTDYRAWQ